MKDIKRLFIDIETGKSPDYQLFEPKYKKPKINKDGSISANSKSIEEQRADFESKCALSPLTGQVLMIGYSNSRAEEIYCNWLNDETELSEYDILLDCANVLNEHDLIIGHYIKSFDLPFIINRCRKHGITPPDIYTKYRGKFYWKENVIDLRDLWNLNNYNEHISLNNMAKYFGLKPKDETIGENFEQVFNEDIEKAIEYCKYDVELTKEIYERLK